MKKKILRQLRIESIISEKWIWIFLLIALTMPILTSHLERYDNQVLKVLKSILDNVSFGYIAGTLFYLLTEFLNKTSRRLDAIQELAKTYSFIAFILDQIKIELGVSGINDEFVPDYLAKGRKTLIERQCEPEDRNKLSFVVLRKDSVEVLRARCSIIESNVSSTTTRCGHDLKADEVIFLNKLESLFRLLLINSRQDFCHNEEIIVASVDVDYFIETLKQLDTQLHSIKKDYVKYVYIALLESEW